MSQSRLLTSSKFDPKTLLTSSKVRTYHDSLPRLDMPRCVDVVKLKEKDIVLLQRAGQNEFAGFNIEFCQKLIQQGSWIAMNALILKLLPNLQQLWLENWAGDWPRFTTQRKYTPLSLNSLRTLVLTNNAKRNFLCLSRLYQFLDLKSLRTLSAWFVRDDDSNEMIQPNIWELKSLALLNSDVDQRALKEFLRGFRCLEKLSYEPRYPSFGDAFEPPRMLETIAQLKDSLLELSIKHTVGPGELCGLNTYPIGSLSDFRKLKVIDITSTTLIGMKKEKRTAVYSSESFQPNQTLVGALPASIEVVCIQDCDEDIVAPLFELLYRKVEFPALRKLNLEVRFQI